MNEADFIELSIRYLDGACDQAETDRLSAEMLDDPSRRTLYRDLVQQAQLAHEWQASSPAPPAQIRKFPYAFAASAAAAVILASLFVWKVFDDPSQSDGDILSVA